MSPDLKIRCAVAGALALAMPLAGCGNATEADNAELPTTRVMGEPGRSPGQFIYPRGIDAGADGLWIVDKTGRVQLIDTEWGEPLRVAHMPTTERGLPTGLTVAPSPIDPAREAVWIADTHEQRVVVFDAAEPADPIAMFGEFGTDDGQFVYLTDVAVLTDDAGRVERVYVSEYGGNDRVSIFDADFRFVSSFGVFGVAADDEPGSVVFNRPQSIAIDRDTGEVLVADACNHRLGRFTLDGELIAWIGGLHDDLFAYPYGITLLEGRTALIAEFGANRVTLVDLDAGTVDRRFGSPGRAIGKLASPWGVAVIDGEAFVLDSGNNRIQAFDAPGRPINRYASVMEGGR